MKRFLFAIIALFMACTVNAQDVGALFTAMPDELLPQLASATRKNLVEQFKGSKEATAQNTMNGDVKLEALTDNFLQLQVSEVSQIQIKLLPLINNSYIICMVNTVKGPTADSRIDFYTTDWKPIEASSLFTPVKGDAFIKPANGDNFKRDEALTKIDIDLIEYSLKADDTTLTVTYRTPDYLSQEDRDAVMPFIKEPIVMKWNKNRFE